VDPGKKFVAAGRKMTHRAGMARSKVHVIRKNQTRGKLDRGTRKGRTNEKRLWKGPECKTGIQHPGTRWQLRLKTERTSDGIDRKAFGMDFMKRAAGRSWGLRKMRNWTVWRSQSPPEQDIRNLILWRGRPLLKWKKG
jgi:hypothetical protein